MSDTGPPRLPSRPSDGHKGTFGTVGVIGGCTSGHLRMIGAPALTARGALRTGAGLVKIAAPAPIIGHVLEIEPSATGVAIAVGPDGGMLSHDAAERIDALARTSDCLAIGPGLGTDGGALGASFRAIQQEGAPVVVDADALNCLASTPEIGRDLRAGAVLTPHPGEFRRLARGLGLSDDLGLDRSREDACAELARRLGCVVVLKGAGTIVSDGQRTWVNDTGHACMGTAGTGDVLTGIIASLIAQFGSTMLPPPLPAPPGRPLDLYNCARIGVRVHGMCGERSAAMHTASAGMLARELADLVPVDLERLRGG